MALVNAVTLDRRVSHGDTVIENALGLGVDVIATSDLIKEEPQKGEDSR